MGRIVRRKGSKVEWEIWNETEYEISVMNYSQPYNASRRNKREF